MTANKDYKSLLESALNLARFLNGGLVYDVDEKDKHGTYRTEFIRRCDKDVHNVVAQSIRNIFRHEALQNDNK